MILANILAEDWKSVTTYANGSFAAGMTLIGCGGLSWCCSLGAYDMMSYLFVRKGPNGSKPTLYDYSEQKRVERSANKLSFLPYIITGAVFVIISLILFIFI